MTASTRPSSYEEALAQHSWDVPERYNIAEDVCFKHPADKLAMIHEDFEGNVREVRWGELQENANRFANVLRAHGVEREDRVAMLLPPTPETAAAFFGTYRCGAILLSMSVLYGDDGIRHRVTDSQAKVLVTERGEQGPRRPVAGRARAAARRRAAGGRRAGVRRRRHGRRRPRAALLLLGHDRPRQGHRARAPLPARARGVRLLPRRAGRRALPRHGRVGLGGRASRRCSGRGGSARCSSSTSARAASTRTSSSTSSRATRSTNVFTTPTAMRSMMSIDDAGTRYPQQFRIVCSRGRAAEPGGDPLVPRAVRDHGARLLRAHGVLSARRQLPVHGRPRGLDGPADAGLGRADPRRGRAAAAAGRARRDLPARALEPALSDRLLAQRRGVGGDVRRRVVPHQGRGVASTRTATSGTRAAPTT